MWAGRSLLVTFHNEAWGGEKFFLILQRLAQKPAADVDRARTDVRVLALGFEGRYRVIDSGRTQLDTMRERLEQLIRAQRGADERELSPHWQPATRERKRAVAARAAVGRARRSRPFVLVTASLVLSLRI